MERRGVRVAARAFRLRGSRTEDGGRVSTTQSTTTPTCVFSSTGKQPFRSHSSRRRRRERTPHNSRSPPAPPTSLSIAAPASGSFSYRWVTLFATLCLTHLCDHLYWQTFALLSFIKSTLWNLQSIYGMNDVYLFLWRNGVYCKSVFVGRDIFVFWELRFHSGTKLLTL
jgi:hypothetical protein